MGTTTSTDDDAYTAQREAARANIIQRESGGQNIFSSAGDPNMPKEQKGSGYYQFIPSSWREAANIAGIDTSKYPLAIDAPRGLQDQAFNAYYAKYGERPWAQSAPGNARAQMASTDTSTPDDTTPDPTTSGLLGIPAYSVNDDQLRNTIRQMTGGASGGDNKNQSVISKIGAALGGGQGNLSGADAESAGNRALINFGVGLLAQSGFHPVRTTMGEALAAGLQGAQASELGSQQLQRDTVQKALGYLQEQQKTGLLAGQLGVSQGQLGVSKGELAVKQAEERRQQTLTDIELQRQKSLLAAPPLFTPTTKAGPAPVAPVAPSDVPAGPGDIPPADVPRPGASSGGTPDGGATATDQLTPPAASSSLFAGPGASTTTGPVQPMPGTPGDVSTIIGGMKGAAADMSGGGTPVAQTGGITTTPSTKEPVIDGSKPYTFQMPSVPPNVSPDLSDDEKANLAERYRLALLNKDPAAAEAVRKDMQSLQTERQNKFTDWRQKQDDAQRAMWLQANKNYLDTGLEQTKAGITSHQKQLDQDMTEGGAVEKAADAAATSAGEANTMLTQLGAALKSGKLPSGIVAQFMTDHPDITNTMKSMGFISGDKADMVQLINGLNAFMSTRLRQQGSGQLRNLEMAKFQNVLPNWLESDAGKAKALAFLMNMNDRIISEADYTHEQFRRPVLDAKGNQMMDPQSGRPMLEYNIPNNFYRNMESPAQVDANGNRTGGGLGAVLPHYDGPMPTDKNDTAAYDAWLQKNVKPGRPYYGLKWDDVNNRPSEVLDVRPGRYQ